ncbi:MAG: alpha/beta hydrolase [Thiogranum sp.]
MPYTSTVDIRIHYQREGKGCPVLFLGGVGGDLRSKPSVFDSPLADSFDILTFDQRGTGLTDKPDVVYTMAQYALDAEAVMDAVGWDSAHVVGVSFGGMVAQELALRSPRRVLSLVLCCSTAGGAGGSSYPLHELSGLSPTARSRKMLAIGDNRYDEAWQAQHPEETDRLLKEAAANASPFLKEPGGIAGITRQIEARSHHHTYDRLSSMRIPTLVCGGKYDGQARPEAVRNLHGQIPAAELRFFEGGHRFLSQDPEAYAVIAGFLQRHCSASRQTL